MQNAALVEARLGGEDAPATLVLDTGAPMTLAPARADALGLEPAAHVALGGPESERAMVPVVRLPDVRVAGRTFRDVGAVVDWPKPPSPVACLSRDGLLGASLLRTAIWQIDFHARRLTVTDALEDLPGIEYAARIPFRVGDAAGSPRIDATVNGAPVSVLVDLGFDGSLAMPASTYRDTGNVLTTAMPAERGRASATVFGDDSAVQYVGRLGEVRLAGLNLRDFPVLTGRDVSDVHLGVAFLRHFRVTIDWLHRDLYLQRRDPESDLWEELPSFGFTPVLRDGRLEVGALWEKGPAAAAGLRLGDEIVAIDGRATAATDFDAYCALLEEISLYGRRVEPVAVSVRRGAETLDATLAREPLLPRPR